MKRRKTSTKQSSQGGAQTALYGWIGERRVRILEVSNGWALVQPWNESGAWELARADLIRFEQK